MPTGTYSKFKIRTLIKVNLIKVSRKESSNVPNGIFKVNCNGFGLLTWLSWKFLHLEKLSKWFCQVRLKHPTLPRQMSKDNQKIASFSEENSWFETCSIRDKWKHQNSYINSNLDGLFRGLFRARGGGKIILCLKLVRTMLKT